MKLDVKEAMAKLTDALASWRTTDDFKAFLKAQAAFYNYSPRNMSLIKYQRPDATYVAGFQKWLSMGRCVKKGEKGISILSPITFKKEKKDGTIGSGLAFKLSAVFDVSQTEVVKENAFDPETFKPFTNWHVAGESEMVPTLTKVVEAEGVPVEFVDNSRRGEAGSYSPTLKRIRIINSNTADMARVLIHEWAHHRVHSDQYTYAQEEVIVESIAYVISQALEIGAEDDTASFVYIDSWKRDDEKSFIKALGTIQTEAKAMLALIEKGGAA